MEKANKNLNRIKVIFAEKNLQNKWLAEKIGREDRQRPSHCFQMGNQFNPAKP